MAEALRIPKRQAPGSYPHNPPNDPRCGEIVLVEEGDLEGSDPGEVCSIRPDNLTIFGQRSDCDPGVAHPVERWGLGRRMTPEEVG